MAHIDAGKTTTTERILYYTGKSPQDRRSPRRRRDHGLDGAGAGARHHHHLGRDDRVLERQAPQHHRHPRPRGLHHRSRALAARARRRRDGAGRQRRRRAADRNRLASGRQATTFRASCSSTRWTRSAPTSTSPVESIRDRLGAKAVPIQLPIGSESTLRGLVDLVRMKAVVWDNDAPGRQLPRRRNPGRHAGQGARSPRTTWSRTPSNSTTKRWKPIWAAKSPRKRC